MENCAADLHRKPWRRRLQRPAQPTPAAVAPLSGVIGCGSDDAYGMARWVFDRPVAMDDIAGVAIGTRMIPVTNGVAGEGYWLQAG